MNTDKKSTFVYVTYIRTTVEKLWQALTQTGMAREYFFASTLEADWKVGGKWQQTAPDGTLLDNGEVLEFDPPHRFALSWLNHYKPEMNAEGPSRMSCQLEPKEGMIKLTIVHEMDRADSKAIQGVSNGWPTILSSLKSLLETGEALEETRTW